MDFKFWFLMCALFTSIGYGLGSFTDLFDSRAKWALFVLCIIFIALVFCC